MREFMLIQGGISCLSTDSIMKPAWCLPARNDEKISAERKPGSAVSQVTKTPLQVTTKVTFSLLPRKSLTFAPQT